MGLLFDDAISGVGFLFDDADLIPSALNKHAPPKKRLAVQLEEEGDWEDSVDAVMTKFEEEYKRKPVYTVCFY